jgi:hypothetical protein
MKIEVTTEMVMSILRSDLKRYLGYEGVDAILDAYNDYIPDAEYDESLFYNWEVYEDENEAVYDNFTDEEIIKFIEENPEWYEEECHMEMLREEFSFVIRSNYSNKVFIQK